MSLLRMIMPSFLYKAKKDSVNIIAGQLNAQNQDEALEMIHQLGLMPVSIQETNSTGVLVSHIKIVKVKNKELYHFARQLASAWRTSGLVLASPLANQSSQSVLALLK